MLKKILGQIERVSIRTIWPSESSDFTPWLAENIQVLGDAIDITLVLESEEQSVGSFRADILAKDIQSDTWVLVENQLGRTDHGHLGQLITYAAGLSAITVVWIAEQFCDEHLAALDWLNTISDDSVKFFGVQLEVWAIGESIAPKFNVVSRPNSWVKKGKSYKRAITSPDPLKDRIQKFILIGRSEGHEPSLSEIMDRCECSKGSAIRYRRELDEPSTGEIEKIVVNE